MLRELRIRNFAIIDDLAITLHDGFTALTGETGAGKSIIVDALSLLLGERASPELVKTGAQEASVEALFEAASHPLIEDLSIGCNEGVILRRSFSRSGRGRSYINDSPVSGQTLSAVGRSLAAIHGQHEHQTLLKRETHLLYLDTLGGTAGAARSIHTLFHETEDLKKRIAEMQQRSRERDQRISFLQFQRDEIAGARLKEGEKEALEQERTILLNLSRLRESAEEAYALLYSAEGSSVGALSRALQRVREIARIDQSAAEILSLLESSLPLIEDASVMLRACKDRYDLDPLRLDAIDERLALLRRLEKKYGESIAEILGYSGRIEAELRDLEGMEEAVAALSQELSSKETALRALCDEVSGKRHQAATLLKQAIIRELVHLGFAKAVFAIDIKKTDAPAAHGYDEVEFLFSANPGEPPKPLSKVASGGELSRIMLALRCVELDRGMEDRNTSDMQDTKHRADSLSPATLIFDEVDAGIGGVTARDVGRRLKAIATARQVLCITHLSQIAALADHHLAVRKSFAGDKVSVHVESLSDGSRIEEIATMLSGKVTEGSLKHARELLSMSSRASSGVRAG
jgi:DNA repair protein RecN (Recombination protein N)